MFLSAVTAIDTSGLDTLCELRKMLEKRSLKVHTIIENIEAGLKTSQSKSLSHVYITIVYCSLCWQIQLGM